MVTPPNAFLYPIKIERKHILLRQVPKIVDLGNFFGIAFPFLIAPADQKRIPVAKRARLIRAPRRQ